MALHVDLVESPTSVPAGGFRRQTLAVLGAVGSSASLGLACLRALRRPRIYLPLTFAQVWEIGIASLPLVILVAMISGAVTSEQTGYQYSSTLPPWIVGSVITASVITELGPLSTGLVLVGRVRDGSVVVDVTVDRELKLPHDSHASLEASGAFGGRYLALQPGRGVETLRRGDTLTARSAPTLAETFATVGTRADEAFGRVSDLLSPDHVASLEAGAKSLGRSVDELTALTVALRATAAGVRRRVGDTRLDSAATDLARTTRTLTGTSAELRAASVSLRSILGKIDQGRGSLGQAVNDPTLYHALLTAAAHVDEAALGAAAFVRDVHARPERYIRVSLF
jgi:phospholipid/cholesterol/gamma-HCH transport system substrate-binding protein